MNSNPKTDTHLSAWPAKLVRMPVRWRAVARCLLEPRRQVIVAFTAVLVVSALLMVPAFDQPAAPLDEGLLLAYPARMLNGALPQRGFYDPYGPGSVWTVAVAFEVLGESLTSERVVGMIYRLTIIGSAFVLACCWGLGAALVAAAIVAATLAGSVGAPASVGFWALALLGYALLARALLSPSAHSRNLIPAAGALLSASALMRIDFLPAVVLACIPAVLIIPARDRRRFAVGVVAGFAPLVLHVALVGPHDVWRSLRIGLGTHGRPSRPPFVSGLAALVALYALATVLLLGAGLFLERRMRRDPEARVLLGAGLFGLGMVPFAFTKLDEPHVVISSIAVLAMLPVAGVVLVRGDLLQRPTTPAARRFALASVAIVAFFACAEAIRYPVYHQAEELLTGSREPSFQVSNAGRSFRLADAQQADEVQAIVTALDRLARPGESLFDGPQDLRTAGTPNDVFLYFLLPQLKPASYFMQVDQHTINRPSNGFTRELSRADFLVLEASPSLPPAVDLGPATANQIVGSKFCVKVQGASYRLYERCR